MRTAAIYHATHHLIVPVNHATQWWWPLYTWLGRFVALITVTMALLALARLRRPPQRT